MGISEAAASDHFSEVLLHDQSLNENFIDAVEKIHMKQRMMGVPFSIKSRDSKIDILARKSKMDYTS